MNISIWFKRETWRLDNYEWGLATTSSLAVGLVTTTAWLTPFATLLFIAVPAIIVFFTNRTGGKLTRGGLTWMPFGLLAVLLVSYLVLAMTWSVDTGWAIRALWPVLATILVVYIASFTYRALPLNWLTHFCRAALIAYCVCLIFGFVEETTDHALKRLLFWPFQAIGFEGGEFQVDWNHISQVRPYRTNWNMTTFIFLIWPILIFLRTQITVSEFRVARILLLLVVAAMISQSHHQAAIVALLGGYTIFGIARLNLRIAALLTALGWLMAFLVVVPASKIAYQNGVHLAEEYLPSSFRHRIVLWKFTSEKITEAPLWGVGTGSTHPLNEARKELAQKVPGTIFIFETGTHPHNIYLQTLYELGIFGALIIAGAGLVVIASIYHMGNAMNASYGLAAFAAWAVQSAFSFGLFEVWYVFALAFTVCLFIAVQAHWYLAKDTNTS